MPCLGWDSRQERRARLGFNHGDGPQPSPSSASVLEALWEAIDALLATTPAAAGTAPTVPLPACTHGSSPYTRLLPASRQIAAVSNSGAGFM